MDRAAYEKARALEKAGKAEEALRAFRDAGAVEDVGRLLAASRRYREAGEVLLGSLQVRPNQVGQLDATLKKRALSAAIWLSKGGESQVSVELFVALGERQRAIETLQRAGDQVGAARLLTGERLEGGPSILAHPKQSAVSGVATFGDLSVDPLGIGYTLVASATGLTGAESSGFTVLSLVP